MKINNNRGIIPALVIVWVFAAMLVTNLATSYKTTKDLKAQQKIESCK